MRLASSLVASLLAASAVGLLAASCGSSGASGADNGPGAAGGGAGGTSAGAAGAGGSSGGAGKAGAGGGVGKAGAGGGAGKGGSAGASGAGGGAGAGGASGKGGGAGAGGAGGAGGAPLVCTGGRQNCSGACADTASDKLHCGACGTSCASSELCCSGVCVGTTTCQFSLTALSKSTGWQNGGDYVTLTGSGFADGMQVFIGEGRAPVLVKSPTSAIIQTPPGLIGAHDVKLMVSGSTLTLSNAFTYASAGLSMTWEQKPMMVVRGEDPGIGVMQDGRVLIAGGTRVPDSSIDADTLSTAEIYNRATDMVMPAANSMSAPRWHNSVVPLLTGKLLVVGGVCDTKANPGCKLNSADLFDPSTNLFAPTKAPLNNNRTYTRSVLMPDGKVFIAGATDPSVEIYDPATDTFTLVAHGVVHTFGFIVRLRDGRVMLGGGDAGTTAVEIYDPDAQSFSATGPLNQGRSMLTAHTLPDGRVAVIGGSSKSAGAVTDPIASIEIYDPKAGTFSIAPYKLSTGRTWHASALVRDGTILVMGGYTISGMCSSLVASVDQIDPIKNTSTAFPKILNANTEWTAVTLLDGSVLGVGGGACGTNMALPDIDFLAGKD